VLQEAKSAGLLRDDGFANVHERVQPPHQYLDVLIATLPNVRNRLAHPHIHTIAPPGFLLDTMILASGIINQLWPESNTSVSGEAD
jgi:hypothetical protein